MAKPSDLKFRRRSAMVFVCAFAAAAGAPALAQNSYSQPVVQPVPPPSLGELNAALKVLARDSDNVPALLRAGWAALALDDTQSALGFFRRAAAIQPRSGEIKAGLATTSLRLDDPVGAVRLFAEAEASGTPMARYAADRGLALDLVGNNVAAQQFYRQALTQQNDPETVRRLALSQAILGDQRASEATLLPLLQHRDLAAYRTRAFALAILGKGEEAVSIAQTMLPAQVSSRLAPYLRYMPRLTRAQQAAAANLGRFPPASEIGRDDPQIAAYSGAAPAAPQIASADPDARLVPTGQPLGRTNRRAASSRQAESRNAREKPRANSGKSSVTSLPPAPSAPRSAPPAQATAAPAQQPPPPVQRVAAAVQPPPPQADKPVVVASLAPEASTTPPPTAPRQVPQPSFSLSAATPPPQPKERVSLSEAFADFATPAPVSPASGAVDISRITPAREAPKAEPPKAEPPKAKPKPKPPANPQRFWVQVATGRDVKALAFDWRRIQREGGALLAKHTAYTAKWGQTRRLLTGPYKSEEEADKAVSALKKKGLDAFEFTSDEGQEVAPLK